MVICFFNSHGIVHKEFVPQGETVNQHFTVKFLKDCEKHFVCAWPNIKDTWMLHHDNVPCHINLEIAEFLARKCIPVVPQPPYSPDLSPYDFFYVPRLKSKLKGHYFDTLKNIKKAVTEQLIDISVHYEFQSGNED